MIILLDIRDLKVYQALSEAILNKLDFSLHNTQVCFVSKVPVNNYAVHVVQP